MKSLKIIAPSNELPTIEDLLPGTFFCRVGSQGKPRNEIAVLLTRPASRKGLAIFSVWDVDTVRPIARSISVLAHVFVIKDMECKVIL